MKRIVLYLSVFIVAFQEARSFQTTAVRQQLRAMTIMQEEITGNLQCHTLFAVRTDGAKSTRSLTTGRNNSGSEARTVTFPADGKEVVIADAIKALSTFYFEPAPRERVGTVAVGSRCEGTDSKFPQSMYHLEITTRSIHPSLRSAPAPLHVGGSGR